MQSRSKIIIRLLFVGMLWLFSTNKLYAQAGSYGYEFLNIPVSAHSAAVGGTDVAMPDDDASLVFSNPALMSNVADKTLNLDLTTYMSGTVKLSAGFVKAHRKRGTWSVGAQVLAYGSMTETDEFGNENGKFSASDINLQGGYSYLLGGYWTGGVVGKMIISKYAKYSSFAMGVDLGVNYLDEDKGFSMSLVARNLGGQIVALHDDHELLPFNLVLGFHKTVGPLRLSLTLSDLTHWSESYYYSRTGKNLNFGKRLMNHIAIGADAYIIKNLWVGIGYNFQRGEEMAISDGGSHAAGLSLGAGLTVKKFKVSAAWAKYHVSASSLLINLSYAL